MRAACAVVLTCVLLVTIAHFALSQDQLDRLGLDLGYDFIGFYTPGVLLNEYPADRLYDLRVQKAVYLALRPGETHLALPYVHAPFEAILFWALAALPYPLAYVTWLGCGAVAYLVALVVATWRFGPVERVERGTVFLLALSFSPFVMESWLMGNVAVLAFVAITFAVVLDDSGYPFLGGIALSFCLNKPSLLVLIVPMLLLSRRLTALMGMGVGAAALILSSALVLGVQVWVDYAETLAWWARLTRAEPGLFRDWKYVDLNAFSRMVPGGRSSVGLALIVGVALCAAAVLVRMWCSTPWVARETRRLTWAATITWSLVLNAYVPIYDCTLLVLVGILAASVDGAGDRGLRPSALYCLVAICWACAWVAQPIARSTGVQIYTVVLGYTGAWLLWQLHQYRGRAASRREITDRPRHAVLPS